MMTKTATQHKRQTGKTMMAETATQRKRRLEKKRQKYQQKLVMNDEI